MFLVKGSMDWHSNEGGGSQCSHPAMGVDPEDEGGNLTDGADKDGKAQPWVTRLAHQLSTVRDIHSNAAFSTTLQKGRRQIRGSCTGGEEGGT